MRLWELIALLVLAAGCSGVPLQPPSANFEHYPENWPPPIEVGLGLDGCAPIDGTYLSAGQSTSAAGERLSNPIFEQSFFYLNELADHSHRFRVSADLKEQKLYFDVLNRMNEPLATKLHKSFSKCDQGWFVTEAYTEGGSGDSPVKSYYSRTRIGLAEDGSLLINSYAEGVWRKFPMGRETRVSDIWYRFESVRN